MPEEIFETPEPAGHYGAASLPESSAQEVNPMDAYLNTLRQDQGEREATVTLLKLAGVSDADIETSFVSLNIPFESNQPDQVAAAVPSLGSLTGKHLEFLRDNVKNISTQDLKDWRKILEDLGDWDKKNLKQALDDKDPIDPDRLNRIKDFMAEHMKVLNDVVDELELREPTPEPDVKDLEPEQFRAIHDLLQRTLVLTAAGATVVVALVLAARAGHFLGGVAKRNRAGGSA